MNDTAAQRQHMGTGEEQGENQESQMRRVLMLQQLKFAAHDYGYLVYLLRGETERWTEKLSDVRTFQRAVSSMRQSTQASDVELARVEAEAMLETFRMFDMGDEAQATYEEAFALGFAGNRW